jgi:hypothetical protein
MTLGASFRFHIAMVMTGDCGQVPMPKATVAFRFQERKDLFVVAGLPRRDSSVLAPPRQMDVVAPRFP